MDYLIPTILSCTSKVLIIIIIPVSDSFIFFNSFSLFSNCNTYPSFDSVKSVQTCTDNNKVLKRTLTRMICSFATYLISIVLFLLLSQ